MAAEVAINFILFLGRAFYGKLIAGVYFKVFGEVLGGDCAT